MLRVWEEVGVGVSLEVHREKGEGRGCFVSFGGGWLRVCMLETWKMGNGCLVPFGGGGWEFVCLFETWNEWTMGAQSASHPLVVFGGLVAWGSHDGY